MDFLHDTMAIMVDYGTEFQSRALEDWAYRRGVQFDFVRPSKPVEIAFIEALNGRLVQMIMSLGYFFGAIKNRQTRAAIEVSA